MKQLTPNQTRGECLIALAALVWAYKKQFAFTVNCFCEGNDFKVNRHTRNVLNYMVRTGVLLKSKKLGDDGHYRTLYSAAPGKELL